MRSLEELEDDYELAVEDNDVDKIFSLAEEGIGIYAKLEDDLRQITILQNNAVTYGPCRTAMEKLQDITEGYMELDYAPEFFTVEPSDVHSDIAQESFLAAVSKASKAIVKGAFKVIKYVLGTIVAGIMLLLAAGFGSVGAFAFKGIAGELKSDLEWLKLHWAKLFDKADDDTNLSSKTIKLRDELEEMLSKEKYNSIILGEGVNHPLVAAGIIDHIGSVIDPISRALSETYTVAAEMAEKQIGGTLLLDKLEQYRSMLESINPQAIDYGRNPTELFKVLETWQSDKSTLSDISSQVKSYMKDGQYISDTSLDSSGQKPFWAKARSIEKGGKWIPVEPFDYSTWFITDDRKADNPVVKTVPEFNTYLKEQARINPDKYNHIQRSVDSEIKKMSNNLDVYLKHASFKAVPESIRKKKDPIYMDLIEDDFPNVLVNTETGIIHTGRVTLRSMYTLIAGSKQVLQNAEKLFNTISKLVKSYSDDEEKAK